MISNDVQILLIREAFNKKNGEFRDIVQNRIYPHPPYPINDKDKSDNLLEAWTPTLLRKIMTNSTECGQFRVTKYSQN